MHIPVLLSEVLQYLDVKPEGLYIDATFGRGGHSTEILRKLNAEGRLLVMDKDEEAIEVALKLAQDDPRIVVRQGSFIRIKEWINKLGWNEKINGIIMDLGVSSPQLDDAKRGFSFLQKGPLDMRMDLSQKLRACDWLNQASEQELTKVFREYGEERFSGRIARAIVKARTDRLIEDTAELADIVSKAHPRWEKHKHPATRVFQAIRIYINDELRELQMGLESCLDVLAVGGRLLVISFHSLEDQLVKRFMRKHASGGDIPLGLPVREDQLNIRLKCIGRSVRASDLEVASNPRARSAILRIMEKVA